VAISSFETFTLIRNTLSTRGRSIAGYVLPPFPTTIPTLKTLYGQGKQFIHFYTPFPPFSWAINAEVLGDPENIGLKKFVRINEPRFPQRCKYLLDDIFRLIMIIKKLVGKSAQRM
jgi:hypothetical protein